MIRKLIALTLIALFLSSPLMPVSAQTSSWSEPFNLSRSGAASQPRLVASPSGATQVFWWDRFDGLTTAFSNGATWTGGTSVSLDLQEGEMPQFVLDSQDRLHAFWEKQVQGQSELWHASMPLGDSTWAVIERLAQATLGYKALAMDDGGLVVAYLRISQSWSAPAGIYFQRLEPGVFVWNAPIDLDTSAYYRLETVETAWLHMAADGDTLTLTWHEPSSGDYQAKTSRNGGWSWGAMETLASPGLNMEQPRSLFWGDGRLVTWQDEGASSCSLMQQSGNSGWQTSLTGLTVCPQGDFSWSSGYQLFWLWGQGSRQLSLAAWDGLAWTQPLGLSFTFTDAQSDSTINLQDLHAAQAGDRLYVVGSDGLGEIWYLASDLTALQLIAAPRSDWGSISRLSSRGMIAAEPALTVDPSGMFHLVYLEGAPGDIFSLLVYASLNGDTSGNPIAVRSAAPGEFFRQPSLLADPAGWLHLTWSGGTHGEIHYSRVRLEDVANPGAWSPVQQLSSAPGLSPQLARDGAGRLYLLYVTPLNENRGVYLVRSLDEGDSWAQPELVFDAQTAGWANLGPAALTIAPSLDGQSVTIHAAWGEEALPGTLPPQGIWYSRAVASLSSLDALTWSSPFEVAGEGAAWPRLVISAGDVYLVFSVQALGVWQRHISLSAAPGDVSGWSTASPAAGWDALQIQGGRAFGVAASGSTTSPDGVLHLIGMPSAGRLAYTTWSAGRWSDLQGVVLAGWNLGAATWVEAASLPTGVRLGLAWVSPDETGLPAVFWTTRAIPLMEASPELTALPTPVVESTPALSITPTVQPSPTPDLNAAPAMTISSNAPLILGGGLAAILVLGYLLSRRRH